MGRVLQILDRIPCYFNGLGLRLCNQDVMSCSRTQPAGDPIRVGLVPTLPRPRNPTISNTPARPTIGRVGVLEMANASSQSWKRRPTVVSKLRTYFHVHMTKSGYAKVTQARSPTLQTYPLWAAR
ncbi:hypothetical protein SCLCIDRAFT_208235 [Scleroderma citrinum Foug A]|uniref:Uncharacterized protein n=1 Tax=Scleroderma citrinum Foug A TaxID=1036808 RepID=A0A0C3DK48_9AGAM|nr:hypothetical protein SCLCIDRAFT_208235 [Scleroderma citrinum Foug A]